MVAIWVDQSLSNSDFYEHVGLKNINNLYKTAGKCEDQQKYKTMFEAEMVSTPEGYNDNIPMTPNPSVSTNNHIARKSLRQFTETFYIKHKTVFCRFSADKSKRRAIK